MAESKIAMKIEEETKNLHKLAEKLEEVVKYEFDKGVENVDSKEMGEVIDMLKDIYEAKEKVVKACYYKQIMEAMEEEGFDDEEDIMDYGRRGYRGQARDSKGRYMSNRGRRGYEPMMMTPEMYRQHEYEPEYYRDMDRINYGKMYYSGGGSNGGNSSSGGSSSGGNMGSGSSTRNYGGEDMRYYQGERGGNSSRQNESRSERARRNYTETKEMHKGNSPEDKQKKMKELENYTKELAEDVTEMIADASPEERALLKSKMQVLVQKLG